MEEKELAQDTVEEGDEDENLDSSDGSLDSDFKAIFGDSEEADSDEGESDSSGEAESTSETVERVFEEGKEQQAAKDPINQQGKAEKQQQEPQEQTQQESETVVDEDGVTPPARLTAQEKQIFSNIKSKTLRKSIQRMIRDHEAGQVKAINEQKQRLSQALQQEQRKLHAQYSQAEQHVQSIRQAIEPHLDRLTFGGKIPVSQAIGELAVTQSTLSRNDPQVAVPELKRVAGYLSKRFQTTPEQLLGLAHDASTQNNEQFKALQDQLKAVTSELNQLKAQPQIDRIRQEVNAVRQEKDGAGRALYPELHDVNFLVRVNPLVEQIMRANPGMTYGDAHRQAVLISRGTPQNQTAQSFPAATTQSNGNKPSGVSSGSVRGRSAAPSGKVDIVKDAPPSGSVHDDWDYIRRSM